MTEDRSEESGDSTGRKGTGMFVPGGSGTVAVPMQLRVEPRFGKGLQGPLSVPAPETSCPRKEPLAVGLQLLPRSPTKRAQIS